MTLQEILFGQFSPPPEVGGFVHRIGFASERCYTPPPERKPRKVNGPTKSEERAIAFLKEGGKPMTSSDLVPLLGITQNQCGIVLNKLFKKGFLKRVQFKKPGTRYYKYTVKDDV